MSTRSAMLGWVAKGLFVGAAFGLTTGCTTMRRATAPGEVIATEEVDVLEGVELEDGDTAVGPAKAHAESVEVAWTDNGTNIQLVKLPKVQPVTASMLTLEKPQAVDFGKSAPGADAVPPRGTPKN